MDPPEVIKVNRDDEISCDGGEYYGHPKIYLTLGDDSHVDCYYCGRRFQLTGTDRPDSSRKGRG